MFHKEVSPQLAKASNFVIMNDAVRSLGNIKVFVIEFLLFSFSFLCLPLIVFALSQHQDKVGNDVGIMLEIQSVFGGYWTHCRRP